MYEHAAAIRRLGAFDEVRECFWKEEPSMRVLLDLVEAERVYVVPLFVSEGYFTEQVLPRELRLSGPAPSVTALDDGRTVHLCPPMGTHASMAEMILRRAEQTAGLTDEQARETGLVVIGHGTERNPKSSEVVYRVAGQARETGIFGTVRAGFLDQAPEMQGVVEEVTEERLVLVPFFVAEGWHTEETIPDDLGIHRPAVSRMTRVNGRTIFYTPPVGTFREVADIVMQRAREAGADLPTPEPATEAAVV